MVLLLLNILTIQLSPPGNTHRVSCLMLTSICCSITQWRLATVFPLVVMYLLISGPKSELYFFLHFLFNRGFFFSSGFWRCEIWLNHQRAITVWLRKSYNWIKVFVFYMIGRPLTIRKIIFFIKTEWARRQHYQAPPWSLWQVDYAILKELDYL